MPTFPHGGWRQGGRLSVRGRGDTAAPADDGPVLDGGDDYRQFTHGAKARRADWTAPPPLPCGSQRSALAVGSLGVGADSGLKIGGFGAGPPTCSR